MGNCNACLTHSCPLFQHLLSERLTSLGIIGAPEEPPLCQETYVSLSDSKCWNDGQKWVNELEFLHMAGFTEICSLLLDAGVDLYSKDTTTNWQSLHYAAFKDKCGNSY